MVTALRFAAIVVALTLSCHERTPEYLPEYSEVYWQDGLCADAGGRPSNEPHKPSNRAPFLYSSPSFRLCVNAVATTEAGTLEVLGFWFGNAAVRSAADAYLTDDLGNHYGSIGVRGAAATGAHLTPSSPARGAFVFPSPAEGAEHFELHDDANGLVIAIELLESARTDRMTSHSVLAALATAQSVSIQHSCTHIELLHEREYSLSLGFGKAKGHYRGDGVGGTIAVPHASINAFLESLMHAPLLEREYRPTLLGTDDGRYYKITLEGQGDPIVFFTYSAGDGNVPWAAHVRDKFYVIPTDTPARALASLEANLPDFHISLSRLSPDPYVPPVDEEKDLWNPPPPRFTELVDAAESGDVTRVRDLLAGGADVDEIRFYDHETPLLTASRNGHPDVVRVLIDEGAQLGTAAVVLAAASDNLDIVRSLLEAGIDPSSTAGNYGDTALIAASDRGHIDVVRFLLATTARATINVPSAYASRTALARAAAGGHLEIVQLLLDNGAQVHAPGLDGRTALHQTVDADVIRVLADAGADIDGRMSDGATPLIDVARGYTGDDASARVGALDTLLELGANVNARDKRERTALMWACAELYGDIRKDVIELLLRAGARADEGCLLIRP